MKGIKATQNVKILVNLSHPLGDLGVTHRFIYGCQIVDLAL